MVVLLSRGCRRKSRHPPIEMINLLQKETNHAAHGSSAMAQTALMEVRVIPNVGFIAGRARGEWLIGGIFYREPARRLENPAFPPGCPF
jgi:hypothetical protein